MIEDSPPNEEIPFVELATRPLEDRPEIRDEARGELMGRLDYAARDREAEVEAATARLESTSPGKWSRQAIAMAVVLLLVAVLAVASGFSPFLESRSAFGFPGSEQSVFKALPELTPEQRDLRANLRDPQSGNLFDYASLRKRYPDDPAVYEVAMNQSFNTNAVPGDYRATWQRLDPHNGIWSYKVAMRKMQDGLDLATGTVRDETTFREGWEALQEALAAEHFQSHAAEIRRRYVELLKPQETVLGRGSQFVLSSYLSSGTNFSLPQAVAMAIKIQAERLEAAKDAAGFHQLVKVWRRLVRKLTADARIDQDIFAMQTVYRASSDLLKVANRMGAAVDKEELERIEREVSAHPLYGYSYIPEMGLMARGAGGLYWQGQDSGVFKPGRMAEYAFFDQIVVMLALVALLCVALVVCIESVRRGKRVNGLADGLAPLFTLADSLWIAGFGAGLPLLWYLGIIHLTPLGSRDLGMIEFGFPPSLIQSLAAFLLLGLILIQTARWRITRRTGFLALGSRRLIVGWITAFLPAATIPLTGTVRYWSGPDDDFLLAMLLSCGIPLLWLLWQGGALLFSPGASALGGVLLARKLAWPMTGLCVLLLVSFSLLRAIEKNWIARDELTRRDPADGGITKMELLSLEKTKERHLKTFGSDYDPGW